MPPLVGGMAAVLDTLAHSELAHSNDLVMFDTGKQTSEHAGFIATKGAHIIRLFRYIALLISFKPDIVHIHTCSGLTFYIDCIFARFARLCNTKYVLHIHGGRFLSFIDEQRGWRRNLAMKTLKKAAKVIALSQQWQSLFEKAWGLQNVVTIINGVPAPQPSLDITKLQKHILFMGAITKNKGILDLIQALSLVKDDFHFHIAGNHATDITPSMLMQTIHSYPNLDNKISVEGIVMGEHKLRLLQQCDIFCLPSYIEGLPMSVLEAMSYQQAVLVSNVGGLPDLIVHEQNGLLIPPGDINAITKGLERLLGQVPFKQSLAQAGKQTFLSEYSINSIVPLYNRMYEQVLSTH